MSTSFLRARRLPPSAPLITNLSFSNAGGYLNVPAGSYTIIMVPTGTVPTSTTLATYAGPLVAYASGSATTFVLIDQQLVTTPGLQVISATDFTPPSASS